MNRVRKARAKVKGKNNKTLNPQKLCSLTKETCLKIRLDGSWGKFKHVDNIRQRIQIMEWKGHRQRKEVGPERQDPTTNVEGQKQRKELWEGRAGERSAFPRKAKGQRQEQERWRILTKIGKVYHGGHK